MSSNIKHLMTVADLDAFPNDDGKRDELISPLLPGLVLKVNEVFKFPGRR